MGVPIQRCLLTHCTDIVNTTLWSQLRGFRTSRTNSFRKLAWWSETSRGCRGGVEVVSRDFARYRPSAILSDVIWSSKATRNHWNQKKRSRKRVLFINTHQILNSRDSIVSSLSRTKSQHLDVSLLVFQLPLTTPFKPVVESRMKMELELRRQVYYLLSCAVY